MSFYRWEGTSLERLLRGSVALHTCVSFDHSLERPKPYPEALINVLLEALTSLRHSIDESASVEVAGQPL